VVASRPYLHSSFLALALSCSVCVKLAERRDCFLPSVLQDGVQGVARLNRGPLKRDLYVGLLHIQA
jgi:hypothetical protein